MALALAPALLGVGSCRFPEYGFPAGSSGSAGAGGGGTAGSAAGGSFGGGEEEDAGAGGATGGAGTVGGGGGVAEAGAAPGGSSGSGGEPCVYPLPVSYPKHCFDKAAGDGESGVDCGGAECAPCSSNQACTQSSDCTSALCTNNACVPVISLTYTPIDLNSATRTPKFRLNVTYLDTVSTTLRELTIRYYYNHGLVSEPVLGLDSQATIDPDNAQVDISTKVRTSVHRFPLGPKDQSGLRTDSYLEIAFDDPTTVTTGTKLVITQDLVAGSTDQVFDQNSHYSFTKTTGPNQALTVYRADQKIWGVEPPLALFPECAFALGVNLNGPALNVDGRALRAESAAEFTFTGGAAYANAGGKVLPITDANATSLLNTARTLNTGDSATWAVPNGKYWAYAWLTSTVASDSGTLQFGATAADRFFGTQNSAGARWALVGPYSVDVSARTLTLTADGSVHIAGLKLYQAEP